MRYILLTILCIVLINSCKTDVDLLADWKETSIVYGLLNQTDTAHYIKINKAFLGEGNALHMAQVFDSVNYADVLEVKMIEQLPNGSTVISNLQRDLSVPKDPGVFSYPNQVLFKLNKTLDDDNRYKLQIHNTKSNTYVTSETDLVKDFTIDNPSTFTTLIDFTNPSVPHKVIWRSAVNGRLYDLTIRFHYTEEEISSGIQTPKYVDWYFGTQKSVSLLGGEKMEINFLGAQFYKFIRDVVPPNSNVKRYIGRLDYMFSVAADDFSTYMEINQPSTGIVQEKPEYTNIQNGIGIFSARYNKAVYNKDLNARSRDSLCAGQYTYQLSFCYSGGPYPCN